MWLIPSTSCPSTPEAECTTRPSAPPCGYSDSTRVFWDTSSGKPVQRPGSWPGWKRRPWSRLLFGAATSPTWTPGLCGAGLTSSSRRRPASPTAAPESGSETPTSAATATATDPCRTPSGSSASVDPPWCNSRMFRSGLQADIFASSERNFAAWATTSRRRCSSLRQTLARLTSGSGCSSIADWLTPSGVSGNHGPNGSECAAQAGNWPSPRAITDAKGAGGKSREDQLAYSATAWPTANAADGSRGSLTMMRGNPTLKGSASTWATPNVPTRGPEKRVSKAARGSGGVDTQTQAMSWPTPSANGDQIHETPENWEARRTRLKENPKLGDLQRKLTVEVQRFPSSRPDETTTDAGLRSLLAVWTPPACPRLSADFQHWLMGWDSPIRNCFDSAATASYQVKLRWHLQFCLGAIYGT